MIARLSASSVEVLPRLDESNGESSKSATGGSGCSSAPTALMACGVDGARHHGDAVAASHQILGDAEQRADVAGGGQRGDEDLCHRRHPFESPGLPERSRPGVERLAHGRHERHPQRVVGGVDGVHDDRELHGGRARMRRLAHPRASRRSRRSPRRRRVDPLRPAVLRRLPPHHLRRSRLAAQLAQRADQVPAQHRGGDHGPEQFLSHDRPPTAFGDDLVDRPAISATPSRRAYACCSPAAAAGRRRRRARRARRVAPARAGRAGAQVDPRAEPFDACRDLRLVLGVARHDQRHAGDQRALHGTVAAVGDHHVDRGGAARRAG